ARHGVGFVDLPTDSTLGLVDAAHLDDPSYVDELRALFAQHRVAVGCVSNSRDAQLVLGPHGPPTDPVLRGTAKEKRRHGLGAATAAVQLAAMLGAPQVRLMLGVPDLGCWLSWWGSDVSWQDNVKAWAESARPLLDLAAGHGIQVLAEPHPKQVAYDPASARALLAAAPGSVGLCVDPANLAAVGHDPVAAVSGWGPALAAVHAKDLQVWRRSEDPKGAGWSRYGPGPAIRFRCLGAGELPWHLIVAALLDEDYHGVLYVEHEDALLPTEQGLASSLRVLRDLLPGAPTQGRTW
ncbi:sugar phosphate isomerase/epimerase family protein, partial [Streptomyces asiaticus]